VLKEEDMATGQRRAVGMLSDDERPFIVYENDGSAPEPVRSVP